MESNYRALSVWVALMVCLVGCGGGAGTEPGGDISWAKSFGDGMQEAANSGKPVMIDLYTDWCGWCKKLDSDVYTNGQVVALAKDFVCIKLNPEKDPENGAKFKVNGFPTIIFTDSDGKEVHRIVGYKPAKDFLTDMKKAKEKTGT
ncbi:MAG: thioredoxin fold domain-containing protein [Planctomycetes bacterium]|nr:thioredoxin fold domain-containing protein [Planctomycetota bacterium]